MSELTVGQLKGLAVNSNVITVPSGHTIKQPGSIVQVVSETTTLDESTSVNGYATSSYYISITPKFSNSKILVMMNYLVYVNTSGGIGFRAGVGRIVGNGSLTDIFDGVGGHNISHYSSSWNSNHHRNVVNTIDSPSTTQLVKYYVRYGTYGGGTAYLGNGRNQACNFTLMEIAQ